MSTSEGVMIQDALDAAASGNVEVLVSLFADDLEWRGTTRGHLWWRNTPS